MKALRVGFLTLASLALLGTAWARPLLLAPIRLSLPPATCSGTCSPEIEGDTLMVSAARPAATARPARPSTSSSGRRTGRGITPACSSRGAGSVHLEGTLAVVDTTR